MASSDDHDPSQEYGSRGGKRRAEILPPQRRSEIAQQAATARWANRMRRADYEGDLKIGDLILPSAVLDDGTRVLISKAFLMALGRPWKGTYRRTDRPNFIDAKNLTPFVSEELEKVLEPIEYFNVRGQRVLGYRAELLPLVCEVYRTAKEAGALNPRQEPIAKHAEILARSLSKVGIIGLVDEATGYQKVRARYELQKILSAYIAEELLPWAKRFPDSYYEQVHRVWGWEYKPGNNKRNSYIGKLTNWLVYEQLPPGVLEDLRRKNPVDPATRRRKRTHHQHLTEDVGHPHLQNQLNAVTTLLRATPNGKPNFFKGLFRAAFPTRQGELFPEFDAGEKPTTA
jgi:hypothetical protein